MTENTSSTVGRAAIDAYLDSVEQALLAAHAPRGDRVQVLQDLESQIVDMLAAGPQPLTEEIVQSVIARLEPPSHFAATYGNGHEPAPALATPVSRRSRIRWPLIAALSCACLPFGCLLALLASTGPPHGPIVALLALVLFAGFVLTPFALWKAVEQLKTQSDHPRDRELVLKSTLVYGVIVPVLLMVFATLATHGYIFVPFGLAAFVYLQFLLIRRFHRHLSATLPPQPTNDSTTHTPAPSVGTAMSMPAV